MGISMKPIKSLISLALIFSALSAFAANTSAVDPVAATAAPKKFKRALVITGGGLAPGAAMGVIAGVENMGWKPDVIIATCGATMATIITHSFGNSEKAFDYMKGPQFFTLLNNIKVGNPSLLDVRDNFESAKAAPDKLHNFFENNILYTGNELGKHLEQSNFVSDEQRPRIVIVAAQANFGPAQVGQVFNEGRFTQVYFTDSDTAKHLENYPSPIRRIFPKSYFTPDTLIFTDKTLEQSLRAGISDPFLVNPGYMDGKYYFTGASDLIPLDLAHTLADEILISYPYGLFEGYQNLAFNNAFGFNQSDRVLQAIQDTTVKWIDMSGFEDITFDPAPSYLTFTMKSHVPSEPKAFADGITAQYNLGYSRAVEALQVQAKQANVRTHLRNPINPKLYEEFTCKNAFEWKTPHNGYCKADFWPGCDRNVEKVCTPVR